MSDLISRQAAMAFPLSREHYDEKNGNTAFICGVECYRDYIEELPSAQQEQRWIPVSERLPEKNGRYLVSNTKWGANEVDWNIFYKEPKEGWLWEEGVIAWMPLPEPYKVGES